MHTVSVRAKASYKRHSGKVLKEVVAEEEDEAIFARIEAGQRRSRELAETFSNRLKIEYNVER